MSIEPKSSILEQTRKRFGSIVAEGKLLHTNVTVLAKPLTPEEAIGNPARRDYPIITGKERIIEACFLQAKGHAFTDSAGDFKGTLGQVIELPFTSNQNRAIFIATLNAVLNHLGKIKAAIHCKDDDPEKCGAEIARHILDGHGQVVVGLIGLNPAIAEHLVRIFSSDRVLVSDLYADNIGKLRFGVEVWDGAKRTENLIQKSDVILVTGTTLQNGTFDDIWATIEAHGKHGLVFGVTAAGVCALNGIERICPYGKES